MLRTQKGIQRFVRMGTATLAVGLLACCQSAYGQLGAIGDAVGGAAEGVTEAAGGVTEQATDVAGQAGQVGAQAGTAANISSAIGGSLTAGNNQLSVDSVQQGGILANAGVQAGDQIVGVAGNQITSAADLNSQLQAAADAAGEAVLQVRRNGQLQDLTADLSQFARNRGRLGISLNEAEGALSVRQVMQNTAAARAGLQAGDEILSVNGQDIANVNQLRSQLDSAMQGDGTANIKIRRNGQVQNVTANLGAQTHTAARIGTQLADIGADATTETVLNTYLGTQLGGQNGLTIQGVQQGGLAALANLTGGDEILAVGGQQASRENFQSLLLADLLDDGQASIRIRRDGKEYSAPIRLCR
jgi:S1-C subfamily serine protease